MRNFPQAPQGTAEVVDFISKNIFREDEKNSWLHGRLHTVCNLHRIKNLFNFYMDILNDV